MPKKKYLLLGIIVIFMFSCDKLINHEIQTIDCNNLQTAVIDLNSQMVNQEVNKLTYDLEPWISDRDPFGHQGNLDKLIERLNVQCGEITAELICYACIYTNPPQSEILITTDSSGTLIYRTIDIRTPNDDILSCIRVHKYYVEESSDIY